jgi:hypothetical protein
MQIEDVEKLLSKGPLILENEKLKALLLKNIHIIEDPIKFENKLDDLDYQLPRQKLVIRGDKGRISRRIPFLNLDIDFPDRITLNKLISERYETAKALLSKQSEISEKIFQIPSDETVILVIVDGLSYHDARYYFDCEPIFVDGATLTKPGMIRIIGKPTIAERLYKKGIENIFGYSYWSREEEVDITQEIFTPIPPDDLHTYTEFSQVIQDLNQKDINRSYIQIITAGLDNICHEFRDAPPIKGVLKDLQDRILSLEKLCKEKEVRSTIFITSDHGILWKKGNEDKLIQIDDLSLKEGGARWTKGKIFRDKTITYDGFDAEVTSLKYPYITKKLKRNEWGVHGGVSYEENVIPWITKVVC